MHLLFLLLLFPFLCVLNIPHIIQLTPHKLCAKRKGADADAPCGQKTGGCIEGEEPGSCRYQEALLYACSSL